MWIFLNDAFFSIVDKADKEGKRKNKTVADTDQLVVRARVKGDIERVFHSHMLLAEKHLRVTVSDTTDYRYRALIPRSIVKQAMLLEVERIDYGNFKDSVEDFDRHEAYSRVWSVMYRMQDAKPSKSANLF